MQDEVKSKKYVYALSLNCVLGSFLFGYEMMIMGCLQPLLRIYNSWQPDSSQEAVMFGMVTAALPLGALVGCFIIRRLLPALGARRSLILFDIGAIIFISLQMLDLSAFLMIFTRFVLGTLIGMNSSVIPKYLLSLSPPSMSGATGSLNQLFITIGIAAAYAMGFSISNAPMSLN
jgi:MFS family permease